MQIIVIKYLLHFLSYLPLRFNHCLGATLGYFLLFTNSRIAQVSTRNIQSCLPQLSKVQQQQLIKDSLIETGKTFTETPLFWLNTPQYVDKYIIKVNNAAVLHTAQQQHQGVILLTPHLGSWELTGLYCAKHYAPMTTLYRPPKLSQLEELMCQGRAKTGAHLVTTDTRGVRQLFKALKQQQLVGILPDQSPPDLHSGAFAPFFSIPALTMTLVSRLAQKTHAPVILCYSQRLPKAKGYVLHFQTADNGIFDPDLTVSLKSLNQAIQQLILTCPQQYQWGYKRFKKRPTKEESDFYS